MSTEKLLGMAKELLRRHPMTGDSYAVQFMEGVTIGDFKKFVIEVEVNEAAAKRLAAVEDAIRMHRDQRGHDRCWLDDEALYAVLPEGFNTPSVLNLPPREDFLKGCETYYDRRSTGVTHEHCSLAEVTHEANVLREFKDEAQRRFEKIREEAECDSIVMSQGILDILDGKTGNVGGKVGISDELKSVQTKTLSLIAALLPFANIGGAHDMPAYHDLEDDIVVYDDNSGHHITAGDVRDARDVLGESFVKLSQIGMIEKKRPT